MSLRFFISFSALLCGLCSLNACTTTTAPTARLFDLGVPNQPHAEMLSTTQPSSNTAIKFATIESSPIFSSEAMWYRLTHKNSQELRSFSESKWSMQPAQLIQENTHRFLMRQGYIVANNSDGVKDLPILKLNLDEFSQHFSSETSSSAVLHIRASLIHKQTLLAQKQFHIHKPSSTANAYGGAQAMQLAQDQFMQELQLWLKANLK